MFNLILVVYHNFINWFNPLGDTLPIFLIQQKEVEVELPVPTQRQMFYDFIKQFSI